jgi:hypothetical protein
MKSLWFMLVLAMSWVGGPTAHATMSVPDPANSTADPCLVVCPSGDIVFHLQVRDLANNPVAFSAVVIDFCGCPSVTLCPQTLTDPYQRPSMCQVVKISDLQGRVDFAIRAGDVCAGVGARVYADGVLLARRNVASPDQDGNLIVDVPDLALASAKRGSPDPTADFDCDGFVTDADVDILIAHAKHVCPRPDPTPTRSGSWGLLKTIYR